MRNAKTKNQEIVSRRVQARATPKSACTALGSVGPDCFPKKSAAYGGVLRNSRKGRQGARRLSTQYSMHVVLRSSRAKAGWSFSRQKNRHKIQFVLKRHAIRNKIRLLSIVSVGSHLHLHIQLHSRLGYKPFIRAITGAIALQIMGASKNMARVLSHADRFWDYRPLTTFVTSLGYQLSQIDIQRVLRLDGVSKAQLKWTPSMTLLHVDDS